MAAVEVPAGSLISITYFHLRPDVEYSRVLQIASVSQTQAQRLEGKGLIIVETHASGADFYTRSAWRSQRDMLTFVHSTPHLDATREVDELADKMAKEHWTGNKIPDWPEIEQRLLAQVQV